MFLHAYVACVRRAVDAVLGLQLQARALVVEGHPLPGGAGVLKHRRIRAHGE